MVRLLLVDDNALFRSLLRVQLEKAGHEVAEAAEGSEALRLHRERPADVILCDLCMPGKDGLETIPELRKVNQAPIIALTGDGMMEPAGLLRMARALGAAQALCKPIDTETVLLAIDEVLKGSDAP